MSRRQPEILAPAGGMPQLIAAVRSGADAVYLGLSGALNARRGAANFTLEELSEAVYLCHDAGVDVHLALNTLIFDGEQTSALAYLEKACELPIDAVIVQDLGLASFIRKCAPRLPMHASTQMTVHSRQALGLLSELGFSRAVLARELSGEEIATITADAPIETEVFIHGALCMSVSGQCLFSAVLGGRSGNRGLCAQPCRLPFHAGDSDNCLSLRDMCHIPHIPFLRDAGVSSIKIEGRLKRPEYVAAAVTACRLMRDEGSVPDDLMNLLSAVFSRSGFSDGYFSGRRTFDMFGVRTRDDSAENWVYAQLHQLYRTQLPVVPVSASMTVDSDGARLELDDGTHHVHACSDLVGEGAELTEQSVLRLISRTGNTPYYIDSFSLDVRSGLSLPPSAINRLRRDAVLALRIERISLPRIRFDAADTDIPAYQSEPPLYEVVFRSVEQIPDDISRYCDRIAAVRLPIECAQLTSSIGGIEVYAEAPRTLFDGEAQFEARLEAARKAGITSVVVHNIGQIPLVRKYGFVLRAGFSLNVVSGASIQALAELGFADCELSFELTAKQIARLGGSIPRKAAVYGRIPMMLTRNCPASFAGCGQDNCHITDRKGLDFPVRCRCGASEIFNTVPLSVLEKQGSVQNIDRRVLHFTTEDRQLAGQVIRAAMNNEKLSSDCTNGLYYRGVD